MIVNKFREVYRAIYNRNETDNETARLSEKIEKLIHKKDIDMVNKVNEKVVLKAASKMKQNKTDMPGGFCSNTFKHGPDILCCKLEEIFRSWLCHGRVTLSILTLSLLPLIKGLKNPACTNNYRLIMGTSLILKLFE